MWKNGQCVTINKKKYRVKSAKRGYFPCVCCALDYGNADCQSICILEESKLDENQYLEEIPAKGKVLAK